MITLLRWGKLWMVLAACFFGSALVPVHGTDEVSFPSTAQPPENDTRQKTVPTAPIASSKKMGQDTQTGTEQSLVEQLQARKAELEERERRVQEEEQRIEGLRRDLEALAAQHAKAAAQMQTEREKMEPDDQEDPNHESLARLVKVYEAMDPEEAALRIGKMKEKLALDILAGIKAKKAANVLAGVEPQKAARLTEGLRFYKKPQEQSQSTIP